MREVIINSGNMMSLMCATGVNQTWRGQRQVAIRVPFVEWFTFIKDNALLLRGRCPFDYQLYFDKPKVNWYRIYLWDIVHIQLNELAISSNRQRDATLIYPHIEDGNIYTFDECVSLCKGLDQEAFDMAHSNVYVYKPEPPMVVIDSLSQRNFEVFLYLVYIQHLALTCKGTSAKIKIGSD